MIQFKRKEILFFIGFVLYLVTLIIENTVWAENTDGVTTTVVSLLKYVRYTAYAFVILKLLLDEIEQFNILYIAIIGFLVLLSAVSSDNKTFLFYSLMIVAAKDINIVKLVKVNLIIETILLMIVMGSSIIGIIPDYIFDVTTRMRHSYGFQWTTTAPIMFFFMILQYIYLRREKMHWLECVFMEIINVFFYRKTNSRMCFLMGTLVLLFFVFYNWKKRAFKQRRGICKGIVIAPVVICLFSIAITYFYNAGNSMMFRLNNLMSNRLQLGKNGMDSYGLSLFGTKIEWIGNNYHGYTGTYNFIDCSYVHILLENGIIILAIIMLCYSYILYCGIKQNDGYLVWGLCFIFIFSITEPRLVNFAYHPFFIMVAAFLSTSKENFWKQEENCKKEVQNRLKRKHLITVKW